MDAKQEFVQVSRLVKMKLARFEQERVEDFRYLLQAFSSGTIDSSGGKGSESLCASLVLYC